MIIFWRLVLVYYLCAVLFYNQRFFAWRDRHERFAYLLQGGVFAVLGFLFCSSYLMMDWQVAEVWPIPGWSAILLLAGFYMLINRLFVYRLTQQKGHSAVFLLHDVIAIGFLLSCSPLEALYHTGSFMVEPWVVFGVGVLIVTKMFSIFIYMVEQDQYGRDIPTIDESFVTMLMRLIFFLIMLLPGWRWVIWVIIWFWACLLARRNRLMDISPFAFYFSVLGSVVCGFLVRYGWYIDL